MSDRRKQPSGTKNNPATKDKDKKNKEPAKINESSDGDDSSWSKSNDKTEEQQPPPASNVLSMQVQSNSPTQMNSAVTKENANMNKMAVKQHNNHKSNMKRFDSNSIDEEEFQDYFSNPQKRKEFDRQRLQQQMKEIQNIAGFSLGQFGNKSMKSIQVALPNYPGADIEANNDQAAQKNYATVSLCCLSVTNPFRNKIIQLVAINPWFDRLILIVIVVNCFFLAMDNEVDFVSTHSAEIDLIFLLIYTIEMVLKIIAMGFFMRAHSYLRDAWNILDFLVVILGWVSNFMNQDNISAIRVIRILRPLRTINSMPGMSSLVSTILNSMPIMFDIMVLFCFMLIMFGTIATQLLGGYLQNRCFETITHNGVEHVSHLIGPDKEEVFCMVQQDCDDRQPEGVTSVCMPHQNPIFNTFSFDNILLSIMNIFQVITLEGWSTMMYIVREAMGTYAYDLFFISSVLFGAFFVLNLMIAVQFTHLGEAFDAEDRRQKLIQEKIKNKKRQRQEQNYDDTDSEEEVEETVTEHENHEQHQEKQASSAPPNPNRKRTKKKKKGSCFQLQPDSTLFKISNAVEKFVEMDRFSNVIIIFICINTIVLAAEFYRMPNWMSKFSEIANYIFTFIFFLEMILKLFGLGIKKYMSDGFNIFDCLIVCLSMVELLQSSDENSGLSVLRAFRLLRIFKIIKSWTSLRILLTTVLQSLSAITNLGMLTMLYLFISALLAKQFFNQPLYQGDEISRYSFQTTAESLVTIFIILTGENWNEIMVLVMEQTGSVAMPAIFFFSLMIIGNYMLLNLFLAILLKFISENGDVDDDDDIKIEGTSPTVKSADDAKKGGKLSGTDHVKDNTVLNDSVALNSSNSNIEEEFEQIKLQLQALSKMNLQQIENEHEGGHKESSIELEQIDSCRVHQLESSRPMNEGGSEFNTSGQKSNNEEVPNQIKKNVKINTNMNDGSIISPSVSSKIVKLSAKFNQSGKKTKKKNIEIDEDSRSLYIFSHNNCFRLKLKTLIENPFFEGFIYHIIAFNSLLLALDTPILEDPYQKQSIRLMLDIISIIFVMEFLIKIIVMGFFIGPRTYLKDNWNILDFIIVFFSIVNWIMDAFKLQDISFVRGFRALRALRPLRMVSKNEGIKTVVNSLLLSIPSLMNVLLIILLFLLVFGILGVQIFKGGISYCNDTDPLILNRAGCEGSFNQTVYDDWGDVIGNKTLDREWITPLNNYNNIFNSMLTFFEICSLEMWPDRMFDAIDSRGEDLVPQTNYNPGISMLFVIFIFLTTFFIMNLFISVIVDKFNEEIKKRQGAHNFTDEQKEWVKIQRLLVHTNPKIIPVEPINCFRLHSFKIVQSQAFEYFIMTAIVINTLFLCIDYYGKSDSLLYILDTANLFFVIIFTCEMALKITAYGFMYYWHVNWNKFDFIIVVMSLVAVNESLMQSINFNVTALRIIRVSRLLRMVKTSQGLRSLLKTLYMSLSNILQTVSLLLLILFTFTVAGMNLFGSIEYGDFIDKNANFQSFYLAMMTLWRACTGESWNGIMHDCQKDNGIVAVIYWLSFQLITFFIFMNVFIAVIYENFNDIQASEDENDILSLKKKDIKAFQHAWAKYNPMGELYMKTIRLPDFLRDLPPPLGYQGIRIEESKLNKIIFCLNIRDHMGHVYYPEVMWAIFHSIVGINDEKVNNCEQVNTILKLVKRKYKAGLGKKVNLDSLCGNKYYRNELTAIKYIQAKKILDRWRAFKSKEIKRKEQLMMMKLANQHDPEESDNEDKQIRESQLSPTAKKALEMQKAEDAQKEKRQQEEKNKKSQQKRVESSFQASDIVSQTLSPKAGKRSNRNTQMTEKKSRRTARDSSSSRNSSDSDDMFAGDNERDNGTKRDERNQHLGRNQEQQPPRLKKEKR